MRQRRRERILRAGEAGLVVGVTTASGTQSVSAFLSDGWNWPAFAVYVVAMTVVWVPVTAWGARMGREVRSPRGSGARREAALALVGPAVRRGTLPDGVDAALWRPAVTEALKENAAARVMVGVGGLFLVGGVAAAAVVEGGSPSIWTLAVVLFCGAGLAARGLGRRLAVLRRLAAEVSG